ncbi:MAG: hypothetical protein E7555_03400 [Ruminococcaceae bacterium]|nr:hypothetical protein [Oscillospiraceae bacterium]
MKRIKSTSKKILSILLTVIILVCIAPINVISVFAATFDQINADSVFLKQQPNTVTCTLVATANMMRRYSMLRGDSNWSSITESKARSYAWISGEGLRGTFTYSDTSNSIANISVTCTSLSTGSSNTSTLIDVLARHPEGVVIYNGIHAVLLTDYTNGVFYCNDPDDLQPVGRVNVSRAYSVNVTNATKYWYVTSQSVSLGATDTSKPSVLMNKNVSTIWNDMDFSFNAEGATSVHLYIYKGTEKYFEGEFSPTDTYTRQFGQTGHYSCYLVAHNASGDIESDWLGFDIVEKPKITVGEEKTNLWEDVSFDLSAPNAYKTIFTIYYNYGAEVYFTGEFSSSTKYTRQFGKAGQYSCCLTAFYQDGTTIESDWQSFVVEESKCKIIGNIYSFENEEEISISITGMEDSIAIKNIVIDENTTAYSILDIETGEYILKASKANHVTREYSVTVGEEDVELDIQLNLIGDINGDGKVNTLDVARANAHARSVSSLSDYDFACADINGDGKVNTLDVARMNAHTRGVTTL